MKKITLIRHAKSDWGNENLKDKHRYLNERGYHNAYSQSEWYATNKSKPDVILSSTAVRALSTALIFSEHLNFEMKNFLLENDFYENNSNNIISLLGKTPNEISHQMIFGHNPWITELCNGLLKENKFDNIPTCGIVSLHFEMNDWKKIVDIKAKFDFKKFPKED